LAGEKVLLGEKGEAFLGEAFSKGLTGEKSLLVLTGEKVFKGLTVEGEMSKNVKVLGLLL
jgi:hypothetical protein